MENSESINEAFQNFFTGNHPSLLSVLTIFLLCWNLLYDIIFLPNLSIRKTEKWRFSMVYENEFSFCNAYLTNGEYVQWKGRPGKGKLLSQSDVFMIPFSIFWCGFAFFWEWSVLKSGVDVFALFGIPFICMGIYIVIGRFFHMAWLRRRTYYVVTNIKIIRKQNKKIDILMRNNMPAFSVVDYNNGSGSIRFAASDNRRSQPLGPDKSVFALENIPDVVRVQQILTQPLSR